jgi:lipopolysaccharide transport system ATP-binding protein
MTTFAISVEEVSKRYRLGTGANLSYRTLRDSIGSLFRRRSAPQPQGDLLWALRDVTFDVAEGEAIGLIGHNGAGKSTLLKILSRITEPTTGRATLRGRVASLLEVGTGFHPELTGRENIFLNGAILGMSRTEIRRNFDAIVDFAGIQTFVDTPVKRYSSGMYVRLAFAVAAHLTPEILLVDEVLAVGDADFQRRCLGRMNEVAHSGRTVVFVSHNLASIEELCPRTLLFKNGRVEKMGPTRQVIGHYLSMRTGQSSWDLGNAHNRVGTGRARITRAELLHAEHRTPRDVVGFAEPFCIRMHYDAHERIERPVFGLALLNRKSERVFLTHTPESNLRIEFIHGTGYVDCVVKTPNLLPDTFQLELWVSDVAYVKDADHITGVGELEIVVGDWQEHTVSDLTLENRGAVYMACEWGIVAGESKA